MSEITRVRPSKDGDAMHQVKSELAEMANLAQAQGEALIQRAQAKGRELMDEAQDRGIDAWKDLKILVKKHQGPAIATAIVGGLLAYVWNRSSGD